MGVWETSRTIHHRVDTLSFSCVEKRGTSTSAWVLRVSVRAGGRHTNNSRQPAERCG